MSRKAWVILEDVVYEHLQWLEARGYREDGVMSAHWKWAFVWQMACCEMLTQGRSRGGVNYAA